MDFDSDNLVWPFQGPRQLAAGNSGALNCRLAALYVSQLNVDIVLVVASTSDTDAGQDVTNRVMEYPAHRLILSAASDVFQSMLYNPQWIEGQASKITLHETEECQKVFGDFLRYLYTDQIYMEGEAVMPLITLADKYNVKELYEMGLSFVSNYTALNHRLMVLYDSQVNADIVLVVAPIIESDIRQKIANWVMEYPAHRLILSAASDVFQALLYNPQCMEDQATKITLHETEDCQKVFGNFLRYLYTDQIYIECEEVIPLIILADKYNVKELHDMCSSFLNQNVKRAFQRNSLVSWLQHTSAVTGLECQAILCRDFIKYNFELFLSEAKDFPDMSPETLLTFLRNDDLVIADEMNIFLSVETWLKAQKDKMLISGEGLDDAKQYLTTHAQLLLAAIRFPMMTSGQLLEIKETWLYREFKELMDKKIEEMSLRCDDLDFDLRIQPRLYTAHKYCTHWPLTYRMYPWRDPYFRPRNFGSRWSWIFESREYIPHQIIHRMFPVTKNCGAKSLDEGQLHFTVQVEKSYEWKAIWKDTIPRLTAVKTGKPDSCEILISN